MRRRIWAVVQQELFITWHSLEILIDLFFFPVINVLLFGYVSMYISGSSAGSNVVNFLLMGMIWWQVLYISQYTIGTGTLWNIWSRNLTNVFISPISVPEYLSAHVSTAILKSGILLLLLAVLSYAVFGFAVWNLGILNMLLYFVSLNMFALSVALFGLGFLFRYGMKIQSLTWATIFLFQPLTGSIFPVSLLPKWLQTISYLFPPTYIFEAARKSITTGNVEWGMIGMSFVSNIIWLGIMAGLFSWLFKRSKATGQFARNEGQ